MKVTVQQKRDVLYLRGGGRVVRPIALEKTILSWESEGKAKTRPDILRAVLGKNDEIM